MARHMMAQLAFGGTVILSGLLCTQARSVIAAHRHHGVRLDARVNEGAWTTLVLRRPSNRVKTPGAGQAEVCTVEGSNPLI